MTNCIHLNIISFLCVLYQDDTQPPTSPFVCFKMVQFSEPTSSTDLEVTVRRDGYFLHIKHIPHDMTVRQLVTYLAKGDTKFFLTSSYTQDVTFMQPEFLDKPMGSYKVPEMYVECTSCQEIHQCELNELNMCIVNEEKGIPVPRGYAKCIDLVDSQESEDSGATATTEPYEEDNDSMPDLVSISSEEDELE